MDPTLPFHPVGATPTEAYALRGRPADLIESWDKHVIVDVVHDGADVSPAFGAFFDGDGRLRPALQDTFVRERDWGASAVAGSLARHLGLRGYYNVEHARVVCDFNRFRGRTVPEAGHLGRKALFGPALDLLDAEAGEAVLAQTYDRIAAEMRARVDEAFAGTTVQESRLLRITIHTYDDRAGSGHRRPRASLIFTPFEYHEASRLPAGIFAPVFPDRLAEFTADRALAYRIALGLEKSYVPVAVNSPYFLPLGGSEMRLQVWSFLRHLQESVAAIDPSLAERLTPHWPLLMDVSRPWVEQTPTDDAVSAIDALGGFVATHHRDVVQRYRYSAYRPNAIEIEVRKDLLWDGQWETLADGHEAFVPQEGGLREDAVERIASVIASGVREYLTTDQPEKRADAPAR